MKLKAGKTYLARDGKRVTVLANDDGVYKFTGPLYYYYMEDGRLYPYRTSEHDLVSEVPDQTDAEQTYPDSALRNRILEAFEIPANWPMTDSERLALLLDLYELAKKEVAK